MKVIVIILISLGILVGMGWIRRWHHRRAMRAGQALLAATEVGHIEEMRALLTASVDINARNAQGWTPLHVAAAGGHTAGVELLLRHGADVNAQSYVGATPLDNAMTYSQIRAVIETLRAHGANGHLDEDTIF